jgi:GAF domain-containing protein
MHIDEDALRAALRLVGDRALATAGLAPAVAEIVTAIPSVFPVDGAGVLLLDEEQVLRYVGSTDAAARLLESLQESTGRGPCVQSLVDDEIVVVENLGTDDRWPDLAEVLVPSGVVAVLGAPVRLAGAPVGSINVYRRAPYAWDESDRRALSAFDRVVERLLAAAVLSETRETIVTQLQHALEARVEIERAVGVVMALENLDASAAFERLRRVARASRQRVREVSRQVVEYRKID